MRKPAARLCAGALALSLALTGPASALSVRAMTPREVADAAAVVVVAQVVDVVETVSPDGVIADRAVLDVKEVWKGPALERLDLDVYLGRITTAGQMGVPGLPRLVAGRTYLLFLPAAGPAGVHALPAFVGGAQGVFEVTSDPDGLAFRKLTGTRVVGLTEEDLVYERRETIPVGRMRAGSGVVLTPSARPTPQAMPDPNRLAAAWRRLVQAGGAR
jgi:hypothetical protein